eukprot:499916_1
MQTAIIVATLVVSIFAAPTPLCTSRPYYNNIRFVGENKKPESTAANIQSLGQFLRDPGYCLGNCISPGGPLRLATNLQKETSCKAVGFRLSGSEEPVKYEGNAATSCDWTGTTEKKTGLKSMFRDQSKIRNHRGFRSVCRRPKSAELLTIIGDSSFKNLNACDNKDLLRNQCYTICKVRTPIACDHYDVVGKTHAVAVPSVVRPCRIFTKSIGYCQLCVRTIAVQPVAPVLGRTDSTHLAKNEYVNQYEVESDIDAFLEEENELQNERLYVFTSILGTSMVLGCCICGSLIFGLTCGMMAVEVMRRRGFSFKTEEILI